MQEATGRRSQFHSSRQKCEALPEKYLELRKVQLVEPSPSKPEALNSNHSIAPQKYTHTHTHTYTHEILQHIGLSNDYLIRTSKIKDNKIVNRQVR
jgi:hypothetical protein